MVGLATHNRPTPFHPRISSPIKLYHVHAAPLLFLFHLPTTYWNIGLGPLQAGQEHGRIWVTSSSKSVCHGNALCWRKGLWEAWQYIGLCMSSFSHAALLGGNGTLCVYGSPVSWGGGQVYEHFSLLTMSVLVDGMQVSVIFLLLFCVAWI